MVDNKPSGGIMLKRNYEGDVSGGKEDTLLSLRCAWKSRDFL
jgi:hypothetical protein